MTLEEYIEQANPHEAGHILVGRTIGVPIFGLDHIVLRGPNNEVLPGHFITVTVAPSPAGVPLTPKNILEAYACMAGGGLAGNMVSKVAAEEYGLEKDRADLKVVSSMTLEDAAEKAKPLIEQYMDIFDKLREAIKNSYASLVNDPNIAADRYPLLTNDQLEQICPQNKKLFPPMF